MPTDREQTSGTAPDYSPAAKDDGDQQADEAAIPLPHFDRYRRFRRQSAPAQALGRQRAGHAVCAREALPDQHSGQHPKAAPRKQRRARQQPILLHLALEEPAGEGQLAGGADGAGAQGPASMYEAAVAEPYSFPHPLRARLPARKRRWGSCWGRSSTSCWAAARSARASAGTLAAAACRGASTTPPSRPACNSPGRSRRPGRRRSRPARPAAACPVQLEGFLLGRKEA